MAAWPYLGAIVQMESGLLGASAGVVGGVGGGERTPARVLRVAVIGR